MFDKKEKPIKLLLLMAIIVNYFDKVNANSTLISSNKADRQIYYNSGMRSQPNRTKSH